MDLDRFWEIVDESRFEVGDSQKKQEVQLLKLLEELEPDEILSFRVHFDEMQKLSYSWDLWGVAYIIGGGCSDDSFDYFRFGLIAAGREKFEDALQDAESISEWASDSLDFEGFCYVAGNAYKNKTGKDFYKSLKEYKALHGILPRAATQPGPSGVEWSDKEEALAARFPKTWAKFGM